MNRISTFLLRGLYYLNKTESFLLLLFLFSAIVLASTQIVLRNIFDTGIFWADSALRVFVLWIGMLGAMYAARKHKHIKIDIFQPYLSPKAQVISQSIINFLTAIICSITTYYSINFVYFEYTDGLIAFANVPVWICELIIPVAFFIMSIRYLIYTFIPQKNIGELITE